MEERKGDLRTVFNQHIELEDFFTGFSVRPVRDKASQTPDGSQRQPVSNGVKKDKSAGQEPPAQNNNAVNELAEMEAQVKACCKCNLGSSRRNAVFGEGNPHAQIVFVGEGPGENEDLQSRPFVGRAGQLLDRIINAMGLKRSDVYIANIVKCRPPENREPRPEEIISCLPFLKRQLELIRPKIIVALGAPAARTLLNTNKPIGQIRGKFFDYYFDDFSPPIKLMPTFHPAYLLRNYSDENRRKVWEDMKSVLVELGLPIPKK